MAKNIFPWDFRKVFFVCLTAMFVISGFFIIAPFVLATDEDEGADIGEPIDSLLENIADIMPVRVVLTSDKTDIDADGIEFATISAQLKDIDGNDVLVAGIPIIFSTDKGVISPITAVNTDTNGISVAILTSGDDRVGGMTNIFATSDGLVVAGVSVIMNDITPPNAPDITMPTSSYVVINIANKDSQILSGVAEMDSVVEIYVDNLASTVWTKVGDGTFAFTNNNLRAYGAEIVSGADYSGAKTVVVKATDMRGNQSVPSNAIYYAQDTVAPSVDLTYDANPAKVGVIIITATYSEPIVGTPQISIDQPGIVDILLADMTPASDLKIWTYSYFVNTADGGDYIDGIATISLSEVTDVAGNPSVAPIGNTFHIDTTEPVVVVSDEGDSEVDEVVEDELPAEDEPTINDEPIAESEPIIITDVSLPPSSSEESENGTIGGGAIVVAGGGIDPNWNLIFSSDTIPTNPTVVDNNEQEISDIDIAEENVSIATVPVVSIAPVIPQPAVQPKELPIEKYQPETRQENSGEQTIPRQIEDPIPTIIVPVIPVATVVPEEKIEQKQTNLLASMANVLFFGTGKALLLIVLLIILIISAVAVLRFIKKYGNKMKKIFILFVAILGVGAIFTGLVFAAENLPDGALQEMKVNNGGVDENGVPITEFILDFPDNSSATGDGVVQEQPPAEASADAVATEVDNGNSENSDKPVNFFNGVNWQWVLLLAIVIVIGGFWFFRRRNKGKE